MPITMLKLLSILNMLRKALNPKELLEIAIDSVYDYGAYEGKDTIKNTTGYIRKAFENQ